MSLINEVQNAMETAWLNDAHGEESLFAFSARFVVEKLTAGGISETTIRNTLLVTDDGQG
jgi:hypothetical protein